MEHDEKIKIENHFEPGSITNSNVFTGNVNGGVFPLPGSQPTINNYYGEPRTAQQPEEETKPAEEEQEEEETPEERAKRKEKVMSDITALFSFDAKALCRDDSGSRITNERLAILFSRCFGCGAHPSKSLALVAEVLWVLLMDKRNQCTKNPNEDYFRQTVLNVLGYYREKGIICGNKLDLARAVFKDADDSLAKNIERGISSRVFPDRTAELLDLYIGKLKRGEF